MKKLVLNKREAKKDIKVLPIPSAFFKGHHLHSDDDRTEELAESLLKLSSVKTVYRPTAYGMPVEKQQDAPWELAEPLIYSVINKYVRSCCGGQRTIRKVLK